MSYQTHQTLARILSTPNQWVQSCQLSMSARKHAINRSMPNQWERSQLVCFNENLSAINVNTDTS